MSSYIVKINFNDGTNSYDFPLVQSVAEPIPAMKATIIEGVRADGSIVIPAGKKSIEIIVKGVILDDDGFVDINTKMAEMQTKVTTSEATLTMKYWTGSTWANTWAKTVRRISEITFSDSFRINDIEYEVRFLVVAY